MSLRAPRCSPRSRTCSLLVIVALALPLALSTSRRIDDEVRASATDAAQVVAASASGRLDRPAELQAARAQASAADLGGARDHRRRARQRCSRTRPARAPPAPTTSDVPRSPSALAGRTVQGRRHSDTLRTSSSTRPCPSSPAGRTTGAVRLTESVGGVDATIRRDRLVARSALGALALAARA